MENKKILALVSRLKLPPVLGNPKGFWFAALLIILGVSAFGLLIDLKNTVKFGQYDFRNRVVGARVMLLGGNPYTNIWRPGQPTTLLDPFIPPRLPISAVTVTPTVLSLHSIIANLHYRHQKFLWFIAQLILYTGTIWLAMRHAKTPEARPLILLVGFMFSCSTFWRLHVERGQAYVLFSFFAMLYISSFNWRTFYRDVLGGFVLGLLVCLRPQMAMLGLPLLVYRKWNAVSASLLGLLAGILIPMSVSQTVWPDYLHAMTNYVKGPSSQFDRPEFELPEEVEGMLQMSTFARFGDEDTSLKGTLKFFKLPFPKYLFLGLLVTGTALWLVKIYRMLRQGIPLAFCTAKALGLVLFVEMVLPIRRMEYSNLILLVMVLAIYSTRPKTHSARTWEWVLLLIAWTFSAPFPPWMSPSYRGDEFGLISPCAILLWSWFTPWKPLSGEEAVGELGAILPARN